MALLRSPPPHKIFERLRTRAEEDCRNRCLCHGPDSGTIARLVNQFVDDPYDGASHAVYILECKPRTLRAAKKLYYEKSDRDIFAFPGWVYGGANADIPIYVGVSKQVDERLYNHANAETAGAYFTNVFPPTRVLDITWYPNMGTSYRAERQQYRDLRDAAPDHIFVHQY